MCELKMMTKFTRNTNHKSDFLSPLISFCSTILNVFKLNFLHVGGSSAAICERNLIRLKSAQQFRNIRGKRKNLEVLQSCCKSILGNSIFLAVSDCVVNSVVSEIDGATVGCYLIDRSHNK